MKLFKSNSFKKAMNILSESQKAQLWEMCFLYANSESCQHIDQFVQLVFSQHIEKYFVVAEKRSSAVSTRYNKNTPINEKKVVQITVEKEEPPVQIKKEVKDTTIVQGNPYIASIQDKIDAAMAITTDEEIVEKFLPKNFGPTLYGNLTEEQAAGIARSEYINNLQDNIKLHKQITDGGFPPCPFVGEVFPKTDLMKLVITPEGFNKTTEGFWDIFATLDRGSLNCLPMNWMAINSIIDRRIEQLDLLEANALAAI